MYYSYYFRWVVGTVKLFPVDESMVNDIPHHISEPQYATFATPQNPSNLPHLRSPTIFHTSEPQQYPTPENPRDMPHLRTTAICHTSKPQGYATPQNPSDIQLLEPQKYATHLRTRDALEKLGERGHFHIAPRIDNVNLLVAYFLTRQESGINISPWKTKKVKCMSLIRVANGISYDLVAFLFESTISPRIFKLKRIKRK